MSKNVILASYPKSGNTWLRIFLTNLLRNRLEPANINTLNNTIHAASQTAFDEAIGVEASCLSEQEMDFYRPDVYRYLARINTQPVFLKIHEAYRPLPNGESMIPADAAIGVVYLVRNPLDVAISLANHLNYSIDRVIEDVLARPTTSPRKFPGGQIRQTIPPWSDHVLSWIDQTTLPVCVARYEDLRQKGHETFSSIARFCGLPCEAERIEHAMNQSSFEELRRQEQRHGFRERPTAIGSFFREGRAGTWKHLLSTAQIERVTSDHGVVMARFDYMP